MTSRPTYTDEERMEAPQTHAGEKRNRDVSEAKTEVVWNRDDNTTAEVASVAVTEADSHLVQKPKVDVPLHHPILSEEDGVPAENSVAALDAQRGADKSTVPDAAVTSLSDLHHHNRLESVLPACATEKAEGDEDADTDYSEYRFDATETESGDSVEVSDLTSPNVSRNAATTHAAADSTESAVQREMAASEATSAVGAAAPPLSEVAERVNTIAEAQVQSDAHSENTNGSRSGSDIDGEHNNTNTVDSNTAEVLLLPLSAVRDGDAEPSPAQKMCFDARCETATFDSHTPQPPLPPTVQAETTESDGCATGTTIDTTLAAATQHVEADAGKTLLSTAVTAGVVEAEILLSDDSEAGTPTPPFLEQLRDEAAEGSDATTMKALKCGVSATVCAVLGDGTGAPCVTDEKETYP